MDTNDKAAEALRLAQTLNNRQGCEDEAADMLREYAALLQAQPAEAGRVPPTNEQWCAAVEGTGFLTAFLAGWKGSESCKRNQMESQVQGWIDSVKELHRLYDVSKKPGILPKEQP